MSEKNITLADLEACGCRRLELTCERCARGGIYIVPRLIQRYGASVGLPLLCRRLASDCPARRLGPDAPACSAHFPQLPALFPAEDRL